MAANLKEVRERIKSVKNTQQITNAMKLVSAAKLRRAQQAIQQMRPYANKLNEMLRNILSNLDGDVDTEFGKERPVNKACIVVVTSNRGLCGAFNTNVSKAAIDLVENKYADQRAKGNLSVMFLGKKGFDYFKNRYPDLNFIKDNMGIFSDLSFDNVATVAQALMTAFQEQEFDAIDVAYGRFKNAAMQFAEAEQFLPVAKIENEEGGNAKADYIFEPSKEGLKM